MLADMYSMKADELKAMCKERGLKVSGKKADLIARLEEAGEGGSSPAPAPAKKAKATKKAAAPAPAPAKAMKTPARAKAAAPAPTPTRAGKKAVAENPWQAPEPAPEPAPAPAPRKPAPKPLSAKMEPGDRVMARYHRDNQVYPGILLEHQEDGRYLVSWDEPDENEPLTSCTHVEMLKKGAPREPGTQQVYHVGDKVSARFDEDGGFYPADLLEINEETQRVKVKWDDPDGAPPTAEMPRHDIKLILRNKKYC